MRKVLVASAVYWRKRIRAEVESEIAIPARRSVPVSKRSCREARPTTSAAAASAPQKLARVTEIPNPSPARAIAATAPRAAPPATPSV